MYVSITGLRLRAPWKAPRFWFHAIRSMAQARRAPGNLAASARTIRGVQHTLTAWETRRAMLAYLNAGAHGRAMRGFDAMATGSTYGFETDALPDWTEARCLWETKARPVTGRPAQSAARS